MSDDWLDLDNTKLMEASKPLFYGFMLVAAFTITSSPAYAGALIGVAVMAAITFVSVSMIDLLDEDYKKLAEVIAISTLLVATLSASYIAFTLSSTV